MSVFLCLFDRLLQCKGVVAHTCNLGLGNRRKRVTASLSSACFTWWVSGQPGLQSEFLSCFKTEQTELSGRTIRAACFPFRGEYLVLTTAALSTNSQKDCGQGTGFVLLYLLDPAILFTWEAGRLVGGVQGHRPFISRPGRSRESFRMLCLAFFAPDVPASGLRRGVVQLVRQLSSSPRPLVRKKMLALE